MSTLTPHRGYTAQVTFRQADQTYYGNLAGITDLVCFQSDSADGLQAAFEAAVDRYLQVCLDQGRDPKQPASTGGLAEDQAAMGIQPGSPDDIILASPEAFEAFANALEQAGNASSNAQLQALLARPKPWADKAD